MTPPQLPVQFFLSCLILSSKVQRNLFPNISRSQASFWCQMLTRKLPPRRHREQRYTFLYVLTSVGVSRRIQLEQLGMMISG